MRTEQVWDKWMLYDDDGFVSGIDPNAPDDVKKAYQDYLADLEAETAGGGCIAK